ELLFTENETNNQRLFHVANAGPYVKDAFHDYLIARRSEVVNPQLTGTKAAFHYRLELAAGESVTLHLRLFATNFSPAQPFGTDFQETFEARQREADAFYNARLPESFSDDACLIMRQAYAGLLWSKQFYYYDVETWLRGDPAQPVPPPQRLEG